MIPSNSAASHFQPRETRKLSPHMNEMLGTPCMACRQPLDFQVPNPQDANRLLAICLECGAWHGVDVAPDGQAAIIYHLPEVRSYRHRSEDGRDQPSSLP